MHVVEFRRLSGAGKKPNSSALLLGAATAVIRRFYRRCRLLLGLHSLCYSSAAVCVRYVVQLRSPQHTRQSCTCMCVRSPYRTHESTFIDWSKLEVLNRKQYYTIVITQISLFFRYHVGYSWCWLGDPRLFSVGQRQDLENSV